jgi:hypothetical protein
MNLIILSSAAVELRNSPLLTFSEFIIFERGNSSAMTYNGARDYYLDTEFSHTDAKYKQFQR